MRWRVRTNSLTRWWDDYILECSSLCRGVSLALSYSTLCYHNDAMSSVDYCYYAIAYTSVIDMICMLIMSIWSVHHNHHIGSIFRLYNGAVQDYNWQAWNHADQWQLLSYVLSRHLCCHCVPHVILLDEI